jgi:excisionase family DNA binding protein
MSDPLLCTVAETAALLRVSADTIRRSIAAGLIPTKRIRCTVRIPRTWIETYVAESAPILLTRCQVSQKLNVSVDSVHTLQVKGLLPTVIIAGRQRIPAAAVTEYVKRNSFAFLRSKHRAGVPRGPAPAVNFGECPTVPVPALVGRVRFSSIRGV